MYDLVIIGGGPAAVAAAVYSGRKRLKTLLITESFGGQSLVSASIENWIGDKTLSGFDLAKRLEEHVRAQETVQIKMSELATKVTEIPCVDARRPCDYEVETNGGGRYQAKAIVISSGGRRRRLGVPGEDKFEGKGVAYCSICDAPIFDGKRVAVVGGGNAGLEAVVDLFPFATEIYLLNRSGQLKGDPITQEEIQKNPKVRIIFNSQTKEILGDKFVTGLKYQDVKNGGEKVLAVDGVFIEIGSVPNSEIVKGLVNLNQFGEILIDHKTASSSKPGIFAAGDVTDEIYKQNNISAGDGVRAALSAFAYVSGLRRESPATQKPGNNG